eukprot:scaffold41498_cov226-Skeletonema_marinoi.AAC.1
MPAYQDFMPFYQETTKLVDATGEDARKYFQKMALEPRQKVHEKNGDVFPREADGMQSCPQLSKKRVPKRKKRFVALRSNFANTVVKE